MPFRIVRNLPAVLFDFRDAPVRGKAGEYERIMTGNDTFGRSRQRHHPFQGLEIGFPVADRKSRDRSSAFQVAIQIAVVGSEHIARIAFNADILGGVGVARAG